MGRKVMNKKSLKARKGIRIYHSQPRGFASFTDAEL
jgi:hypothetical protein